MAERYDVNLEPFKETFAVPGIYEGAYDQSDFFVNTKDLMSTVGQHLPTVDIVGIGPSFDQKTQDEKMKDLIDSLVSQYKGGDTSAIGKSSGMVFSENSDGSYTHVVEKGDTYWKVARNVVMSQKGTDNPAEVSNSEVQKMMDVLIAYNGKTSDSANRIAVGEQIYVPKEVGDAVELKQDVETPTATLKTTDVKPLTDEEWAILATTNTGIKLADMKLNPHEGVYNPLQPPGLEPGQEGAYDLDSLENYDIEDKKVVANSVDPDTGIQTITYKGEVDSGFGTNGVWWNDTPFDATDKFNAQGVLISRRIQYASSSVSMNFPDGCGNKIDKYVQSVENELDPRTGNYNSRITTADGAVYVMQVDGQSGRVIKESINQDFSA